MPTYTNSSLISYTCISPNKNTTRISKTFGNPTGVIDKITIHCMAGNCSVETCGRIFSRPERQASSNYGIGSDGRIALYVDEAHRSWCSSSGENDYRAITIEVANDGGAPEWHCSAAAMNSLIDLCVDICQRNNIEKLEFTGDAKGNLTMHQYFAATSCPGNYLKSQFPYIAKTVNERLEEGRPLTTNDWKEIKAELDKRDAKIKKLEEQLEKKTADSVVSVNWNEHITPNMGGKEAVAMINDLVSTGDFKGQGKGKYGLSAQMVRLMLIFYRLLKRLVKVNNLKWK